MTQIKENKSEGTKRGVNWFNNRNFKIKVELNRQNSELRLWIIKHNSAESKRDKRREDNTVYFILVQPQYVTYIQSPIA